MKTIVEVVVEDKGYRVVEQEQTIKTKLIPDKTQRNGVRKEKVAVGKKYAVQKADNMNREYNMTKAAGRLFAKANERAKEAGVQTYTPLYFTNDRAEAIAKFNKMSK